MPSVVILDLDGTLIDLPVDIEAARARLAAAFAPRGFTLPFRPVLARIDEAATTLGKDLAERAALIRLGRGILDDAECIAAAAATARPGAAALLADLAARGIPVGIWTDNGRACVDPALRSAGLPPAVHLCTRDDAPAPKPDPRGLVALIAQLGGGAGDRAHVVGDAPRDLEAARLAAPLLPGVEIRAMQVTTGLDAVSAWLLG